MNSSQFELVATLVDVMGFKFAESADAVVKGGAKNVDQAVQFIVEQTSGFMDCSAKNDSAEVENGPCASSTPLRSSSVHNSSGYNTQTIKQLHKSETMDFKNAEKYIKAKDMYTRNEITVSYSFKLGVVTALLNFSLESC